MQSKFKQIVQVFFLLANWASTGYKLVYHAGLMCLCCSSVLLESLTYINSIVSVLDSILKKIGVGLVSSCF